MLSLEELDYAFNIHNYFLCLLSLDEKKKFHLTKQSFQNFETPVQKQFLFLPSFKPFVSASHSISSSQSENQRVLQQPEQSSHNSDLMKKDLKLKDILFITGMENDIYLKPDSTPLLTMMQKEVFEKLRITLCKYSTRKHLNQILEEDNEFASALEEAETISKQFQNRVVVTTYNNLPYIIDFVTPILEPSSLMHEEFSFQGHLEKNHQQKVQHSWQPLIKAKVAYGVDEKSTSNQSSFRQHVERYLQSLPPVSNELFMDDENTVLNHEKSIIEGTFLLPEFTVGSAMNSYVTYMAKVVLFVAKHIKSCLKHYLLLQQLETKINYSFKDKLLLRTAMTTPTYVNQKQRYISSNQRLEFLGDCVLDLVVTNYLFEMFKERSEGHLSKKRSILVRNLALAEVSRALDLSTYALPKQNDFDTRIQSDLLEALIGAIFLDSEFSQVTTFVFENVIKNKIKEEETPVHYRYHTFESLYVTELSYGYFNDGRSLLTIEEKNMIKEFESKLGIEFKNKFLLLQALTHSSRFTADHFNFDDPKFVFNYERLELLGDAILKFVAGSRLFIKYPTADESLLSNSIHSHVDGTFSLPLAAKQIELHKFIRHALPESVMSSPDVNPCKSITSDVFEALIAAVYLDQGGLYHYETPNGRLFDIKGGIINRLLLELRDFTVNPYTVQVPFKNELQTIVQTYFEGKIPTYRQHKSRNISTQGSNDYIYRMGVYIDNMLITVAEDRVKKNAENFAASQAIKICQRFLREQEAALKKGERGITKMSFNITNNERFIALIKQYNKHDIQMENNILAASEKMYSDSLGSFCFRFGTNTRVIEKDEENEAAIRRQLESTLEKSTEDTTIEPPLKRMKCSEFPPPPSPSTKNIGIPMPPPTSPTIAMEEEEINLNDLQ